MLGRQAGLEILAPLAATVLGGLVTALPVVLFAVPALYLRTPRALSALSAPSRADQATQQTEGSES